MSAGSNALRVERLSISRVRVALAMLLVAAAIATVLVIAKTSAPAGTAGKTTVPVESSLDHPRGHPKLAHRDSRDHTSRMRPTDVRRGY